MERDAGIEQRTVTPEGFYTAKRSEWSEKLSQLKSKSRRLGWLRLLFFLLAVGLPFLFFKPFSALFLITMLIPAVIFVRLVKLAGKVNEQIRYASHLLELNTTELDVLRHSFESLPDGNEFIDPEHDFTYDLDIFGKGSLFQYLNRTSTKGGYSVLAGRFISPFRDKTVISEQQDMISELSSMPGFRQEYYALGKMTRENIENREALISISNIDLSFFGKKEAVLTALFIPLTGIILGFVTAGVLPVKFLVWLFFAGLLITAIYLKRINKIHKQLSKLGDILEGCSKLIHLIEKTDFSSKGLIKLKSQLSGDKRKASEVIKQLSRYVNMLDQRLNMLTGILLNGFLLWDLYVTGRIKKWHADHGASLEAWFDVLKEVDALNSLAGFRFNHPGFTFPRFSESGIMTAKNMGHPLIPADERVNNDFDITGEKQIVIITGANMAGKSTFLRTAGVNMVLAGMGTVVCASEFVFRPVRLITSMRTFDSLYKHESYFFSELKRLKYIVEEIKRGEEVFFILDEILKGTNSHDKTKGSLALTEKLLSFGASGLIATHDLELGKLPDMHPGKIVNNCFEVEFDNGRLKFDYILRNGITLSHNATYLMKNMGLID